MLAMPQIIRPNFNHNGSSLRRSGGRVAPPKWRSTSGLPTWPVWCLVAVSLVLVIYLKSPLEPSAVTRQGTDAPMHIDVVDGDTVRSGGQSFRLVGYNTPESGLNAQCAHERALAAKATARLQQLLDEGNHDLRRVRCACAPGTEGTRRCNYGRLCARLFVNGRDVGTTLIAEGLAERYECWSTSCPQRKDWCRRL